MLTRARTDTQPAFNLVVTISVFLTTISSLFYHDLVVLSHDLVVFYHEIVVVDHDLVVFNHDFFFFFITVSISLFFRFQSGAGRFERGHV